MNSIVTIGCAIVLIGSFMLGTNSNNPDPDVSQMNYPHFSTVCTVRS